MDAFELIRSELRKSMGDKRSKALAALAELEKAAPQFVAGEVTAEMSSRVANSYFGVDTPANMSDMLEVLRYWQRELGPALGLETQRHRDNEIDALKEKLARSDARIAELERECTQWREELRIYRETENKRIAELEQSVTVRDTEIARLETDLELARRDAERYRWLARFASYSHIGQENGEWFKRWTFAGPLAYALEGETLGEAIDKARAGNGGGV